MRKTGRVGTILSVSSDRGLDLLVDLAVVVVVVAAADVADVVASVTVTATVSVFADTAVSDFRRRVGAASPLVRLVRPVRLVSVSLLCRRRFGIRGTMGAGGLVWP